MRRGFDMVRTSKSKKKTTRQMSETKEIDATRSSTRTSVKTEKDLEPNLDESAEDMSKYKGSKVQSTIKKPGSSSCNTKSFVSRPRGSTGKRKQRQFNTMETRKVIVDTDPGTDDAGAILLLLGSSDINVVAITVTQGNTSLQNASRNAMRILALAARQDIPVYSGSNSSFLNIRVRDDFYFGQDGMGDVVSELDSHLGQVQSERAVNALSRIVSENPGEISLLCIGPLTNLALAMKVDLTFNSKLKECVIMGGNYTGRGNITAAAEFNFFRDPEAAQVVLTQLSCPITLIPWELCLSLELPWEWYDNITSKDTKNSNFIKAIGGKMVRNAKEQGLKYYVAADEIASAYLIKNEMAVEKEDIICEVELAGHLTRGQVVVDWGKMDVQKNVTVIKKIDVEIFRAMMEDMTNF